MNLEDIKFTEEAWNEISKIIDTKYPQVEFKDLTEIQFYHILYHVMGTAYRVGFQHGNKSTAE